MSNFHKENKKQVRANFRNAVFERDQFMCRVCSSKDGRLDAHHVTDRNDMPAGGYVKENGISLCVGCHVLAEQFHRTGVAEPNYSPEDLYKLIGSSREAALAASQKLAKQQEGK